MNKLLKLLLVLLMSTQIYAAENSLGEIGWYWVGKEEQSKRSSSSNNSVATTKTVEARMDQLKKSVKLSLDQAVLDPTDENVTHYVKLQNALTDQAARFTETWQAVLLAHPELNYSFTHPTNSVALQVYHDNEGQKKDQAIYEFAKSNGLFFFYKSTCPYCRRFAPILKRFAEHYGIAVVGITLDGIALPEFPDSKHDQGQAEQFHVTVEPSLFAVNPATGKAYPVAYGLVSDNELRDNLYNGLAALRKAV